MPEPAAESSPEFVTISEAARALQLSERQVRRYASQLEPTDKRQDPNRQHKGQPVGLVRLLSVESLLKSDIPRGESSGKGNGHASGGPVEPSGKASGGPLVGMPVELAEALQRAAVAEARAELLERERNDWKEQASSLTEALRAAQDEARAARVIGQRQVQQIEASGLSAGDSGEAVASGGGITTSSTTERSWWQFWKARG
jgi:hypothetical protein